MAGVFIDRTDQVNETDETNNHAFVDGIAFNRALPSGNGQQPGAAAAGADLVIASADFSPWAPVRLAPGMTLSIWARVENRGTAPSGPFWLEFWGSKSGGLTLDEFVADSALVSTIAPGGAVDLALTRSLYSIPDGRYTFTVLADRLNQVAESDESNNKRAVAQKRLLTIRPSTQANLVVENFTLAPSALRYGRGIALGGKITNAGAENTGPFWIEFWGSTNLDYPTLGFYLCDSIAVSNLAPGASVNLSTYPRSLYSGLPTGDCAIICFADRTDLVNETNEADNYTVLRGYTIAP